MSKYTITEIAKLCETSPATVSRVMNNPEIVAAPLRAKILETMNEVGYKPNPFASRLSSKARWGLALFVFDILNPFFAMIVRKISHLAMEQGIPLTICDTENNPEKERLYLDYLIDNKIGGIIFSEGISLETIESASRYTETVLIDRHSTEGLVSEVSSDNYNGARQAVEYLLQLNHKRIGFISGPQSWPSAEERYKGYRDALEEAGIPFEPKLVSSGDLRFEAGIDALEYFLTLSEWPTAIFSANDQMAFGVLNKAKALNISIPEDISLVGFDNIPYYTLYNMKLTTVEQDVNALGRSAFELMLKKLNGERANIAEEKVVIPTKLIIGETCRKQIK